MKFKSLSIIFCIVFIKVHAETTIIHNINGYSLNQYEMTQFEAIAFANGKVKRVGNTSKLSTLFPNANMIDGMEKTMLPGLHDSHINVLQAAINMNQLDLRETKSLEEVITKVEEYVRLNPNNSWVEGYGWDHNNWDKPIIPTNKDLDKIKTKKPIWLKHNTENMGWANTNTMKICRAFKYTKSPAHGKIIYNKNGSQTGIYYDSALNIIQPHIKRISDAHLYNNFTKMQTHLIQNGITSTYDSGAELKVLRLMSIKAKSSKLKLRFNASVSSKIKDYSNRLEFLNFHDEYDYLHIHGIKYYIDGNINRHTAAVSQPYLDYSATQGILFQSLDFIYNDMITNSKQSWQASFHAIGGTANSNAIKLMGYSKINNPTLRPRIEHATLIKSADFKKLKKLQSIISITPNQAIEDIDLLKKRINPNSLKKAHPWNSLIKNNSRLIAGSNYPFLSVNPFYGIHAAVTRQNRSAHPNKPWIASERVSIEDIFAAYTINSAYANRQENTLGSLEMGKWADFILIDQDIFAIEPENIWKTKVIQTWIAGEQVFDALQM